MTDSDAIESEIPTAIGRYRVVELVGMGASGTVYRAIDPKLARTVAVKVVRFHGDESDEAVDRKRKRLSREARLLARCDHPNVETIFDVVDHDDGVALVAEYIAGHTLADLLEDGPLENHRVAELGIEIARGLAAVHAAEIVHGDLSPSNIRITPDGRVKIIDFGIARPAGYASKSSETVTLDSAELGGDSSVAGTLPYMAPETLRGNASTARADVYGLGAVLYHCATGQKPFDRGPLAEWIDAVLNQVPAAPTSVQEDLDPRIERVIIRAMSKDPSRRFESAIDVRDALEKLSARTTVEPVRRLRIGTLAASFVVAGMLALGGYFTGRQGGASPESERAARNSWGGGTLVLKQSRERRLSIAVLPFFAASIETSSTLDAGGAILSEAIRNQLRELEVFERVISGTTSRAIGREESLSEFAESVEVDYVLEGSIIDLGDGLTRIHLALIDVDRDAELWAESFDATADELPGRATLFSAELASRIALELGVAEPALQPAPSDLMDSDDDRLPVPVIP